jgi:hypothetical protein
MLTRYLRELISEWVGTALLLADVVIFAISSLTQTFTLPPEFYWTVAGIGFVIANFRIYARLQDNIDRYESQEPNITVELLETKITHEAPMVDDILGERSNDGLSPRGIPYYPMIQAKVKVENIGRKSGTIHWYIDLKQSVLPKGFVVNVNKVGHEDKIENEVDVRIDDKSSLIDTWSLPLDYTTIINERAFAASLAEPDSYSICFYYSITGSRKWPDFGPVRELRVEGDLEYFKQSVIKKWEKRGMTDLVRLTRGANPEVPTVY